MGPTLQGWQILLFPPPLYHPSCTDKCCNDTFCKGENIIEKDACYTFLKGCRSDPYPPATSWFFPSQLLGFSHKGRSSGLMKEILEKSFNICLGNKVTLELSTLPSGVPASFADNVWCIFWKWKGHWIQTVLQPNIFRGILLPTPCQGADIMATGAVGGHHAVIHPLLALYASVASEARAWKKWSGCHLGNLEVFAPLNLLTTLHQGYDHQNDAYSEVHCSQRFQVGLPRFGQPGITLIAHGARSQKVGMLEDTCGAAPVRQLLISGISQGLSNCLPNCLTKKNGRTADDVKSLSFNLVRSDNNLGHSIWQKYVLQA